MQGANQTKPTQKNTAKDGGKKKQAEPSPDPDIELQNPETKYEEALFKRIKNAKKKLRQIEELEEKMKDKEYQANDAQKEKLASKVKLEAELNEVRGQAVMYLEAKKDHEKKQKKEMEKLESSSKKQAVRQVASLLCMSTILQKGHSLGTDDGDQVTQSIQHFTNCINKLMNSDGGPYEWSKQVDAFSNEFNKVVLGLNGTIPDVGISYKDLNAALQEAMKQLPAVIDDKKEVEEPVEVEEEEPAEVEEEEPAEPEPVHQNGTVTSEPAAAEDPEVHEAEEAEEAPVEKIEEEKVAVDEGEHAEDDTPAEATKEPVGEKVAKAEGEEEGEGATGGEDSGKRGDRGRGGRRGYRGGGRYRNRGNYEGGRGRGGGEGGEGGDGKFYKNQRPRTAKTPKNDEDSDFQYVGKKTDNQRGGRGYNRVRRGGGGRYRDRGGERGDRGGEGSSKGARGFRGGERGGFGGGDKPAAHHNGDSKGDHGTTATE